MGWALFALLQIYPLEATCPARGCRPTIAIAGSTCSPLMIRAIGSSNSRPITKSVTVPRWTSGRHGTTSIAIGAEEHDCKFAELERKYRVRSPTMPEMRWQIVAVGTLGWPHDEQPAGA